MDNNEFSKKVKDLLISKNGYVCDTGSELNVNECTLELLKEKINKHPLLWKFLFMIA